MFQFGKVSKKVTGNKNQSGPRQAVIDWGFAFLVLGVPYAVITAVYGVSIWTPAYSEAHLELALLGLFSLACGVVRWRWERFEWRWLVMSLVLGAAIFVSAVTLPGKLPVSRIALGTLAAGTIFGLDATARLLVKGLAK